MSEPLLAWDFYRSFLAVMQEGSLSRAARALGLTQPTIGRHIASLEVTLGAKLFTRSQHGLSPTAQARALVGHAETMSSAAEAFLRLGAGDAESERGPARITASEFVGVEVLPPILAQFRTKHPDVVLELDITDRTQDLLKREADIAVRMTRPTQAALVARRIGAVGIGLYAHRRYIEAHGAPKDVRALARHAFIGFDRDASAFRGTGMSRERFAFRADSDLARLAALRSGIGIGGCQKGVAARDPGLVSVLADTVSFTLDMWLVMHEDLRAVRRLRLLYDHLAEGLSAYIREGRHTHSTTGRKTSKSRRKRQVSRA